MTDSPRQRACPPAGTPALEQHEPHPEHTTGDTRTRLTPPPPTACADRRRRQGPAAATAGALPGAPWPRRLPRRAQQPAETKNKRSTTRTRGWPAPLLQEW